MIFYGLLIGLAVGAATGGHLSQLGVLQIRWWWAGVAAIAFQIVLFSTPIGSAMGAFAPVAYVLSTAAVLAAVLANLATMGFRAVGSALMVAIEAKTPLDRITCRSCSKRCAERVALRLSLDFSLRG